MAILNKYMKCAKVRPELFALSSLRKIAIFLANNAKQIKISLIPTLYTTLKTYKSKIIIIGKIGHRKMPQTNLKKNLLEIIKLLFVHFWHIRFCRRRFLRI
jgi:hypothetical protein